MDNTSREYKETLKKRSTMLFKVREFFHNRGVMEVDCPILGKAPSIDHHIDIMSLTLANGEKRYLHSSPEYQMKRLLSIGMGDIYQMSHVFREEESGSLHNPEFTLIEWYRAINYPLFIQETLSLIKLFIGEAPEKKFSYRELLIKYAGIDYVNASLKELQEKSPLKEETDRDTLLQLIMSTIVEPNLPPNELIVVTEYPHSQAALAQTKVIDGIKVAERFEVYYNHIELANGYHELRDPIEQRRRLEEENRRRMEMGKKSFPLDEPFLKALEQGIPDCCGVAVGFDRLLMLHLQKNRIEEVLPLA